MSVNTLLLAVFVIAGVMFDAVLAFVIVPNTDWAVVANDELIAWEADVAYEEVPNKEPVIPFDTVREFKAADEPLVMTFFQLGILNVIMIGYRIVSAHSPWGSII